MRNIAVGYPLIRLQSVDSTNIYAASLLRESKVTEGTVILAVYQSHGKGHGSNHWVSDAGSNLLLSIILLPDFLLAERQFYLSMCISNAIHDFITSVAQPACIKWPNDILLDRRKLAGILIENTLLNRNLHTSVVGIGINVNQREFPPDLPNPTSLSIATGKEYDLTESLSALFSSLNIHILTLYNERFAEIKTSYLNNLWGLNEWAVYTDSSGTFDGRIVDVADSGELIVAHRSGALKQYGFKEITFSGLV